MESVKRTLVDASTKPRATARNVVLWLLAFSSSPRWQLLEGLIILGIGVLFASTVMGVVFGAPLILFGLVRSVEAYGYEVPLLSNLKDRLTNS